jgi:hypothetical protein
LGDHCEFDSLSFGVKPRCNWQDRPDAFVLRWYGPLDDTQGGRYWCQPDKQRSWNPASC